jgi:L-alanine-DL-glutamate epimerase-like enolase superfamily enzyme
MTKFVAERVNVSISQGERVFSRWGYAPYFVNGSAQLIQPDIGNCGGITEAKKICDMAYVYDVGVQAHVCASPLSTAAALQLEAAIPNFTIHEHHVYNRYDYNKQLCIYDYQPVNGYFEIPDLPGLGNELSDFCFSHGEVVTVH